MLQTCGNDSQKLAWLQATEPELVSTLHEIHRAKKALRGHSSAHPASNGTVVLRSASSEWTLFESNGYQSAALASLHLALAESSGSTVHGCALPRRSSSSATRTTRLEEPHRLQRTKSAATLRTPKPVKALNKSSVQTLLPRDAKQKEQQTLLFFRKEMQIFLDRRAALGPAAKPKLSMSPVRGCTCTPKSSHRRHQVGVAEIEVSGSNSLRLRANEAIVPQTWTQSLCHFLGYSASNLAR